MKLSEVKTEGNFKLLIIGTPGSGKTCFASSFPTPIKYIDFDNKVDSAALFHKGDKERLDNIDVEVIDPKSSISVYQQFQAIMKTFDPTKYKTLVIDSLSALSTSMLKEILDTNPGIAGVVTKQGKMPSQPHYGVLLRAFTELIPNLLSLPVNVIMCGHLDTYKDKETGTIIRSPMLDGSFSDKLPQYFKECWYAHVDDKGKFLAQTRADSKFACLRSQIPGIPATIPLDYKEVQKYLS